MKHSSLFILLTLVCASPLFATLDVGDPVPSLCWKDSLDQSLCLNQSAGKVRVLLHGAGWCPACKDEIRELVRKVADYESKPVLFINLLSEGYTEDAKPSADFLTEWKSTYRIPFPVVASPRNAGRRFFEPPIFIPNVVIIGRTGKLLYKEMGADVDELLEQVDEALEAGD